MTLTNQEMDHLDRIGDVADAMAPADATKRKLTPGQWTAITAITQNYCKGIIGARTMRQQIIAAGNRP